MTCRPVPGRELERIYAEHARGGEVRVDYDTEIYIGRMDWNGSGTHRGADGGQQHPARHRPGRRADTVAGLLRKWGRLHAVRSVLSTAAFLHFVALLSPLL